MKRLIPLALTVAVVCVAGTLFPQTRTLEKWILMYAYIPLQLSLIGAASYLLIRLSSSFLKVTGDTVKSLAAGRGGTDLVYRVDTFFQVLKGVAVVIVVIVALLLALEILGVDILPVVAGAGLVGLALTLSAQNLFRDMISGLLIMIEGRYLVNERITINDCTGTVRAFNLRVTQIRDDRGRLITIPNGTIGTISNHSREDLREIILVPLPYTVDPTRALAVISQELPKVPPLSERAGSAIKGLTVLGIEGLALDHYLVGIEVLCSPGQAHSATSAVRIDLIKIMASMHERKITCANEIVATEPENEAH